MKSVKSKKSGRKIALIIIIAVFLLWVLLIITDFFRFALSDGYVKPIINVTEIACKCGESRSETGIGYSFDYGYIIDPGNKSWKYDKEKPNYKSFSIFGFEIKME